METPALQKLIPDEVWQAGQRPLPGIQPLGSGDWLRVDDAFAAQMALRDKLITERSDDVYQMLPQALDAACECLDKIIGCLRKSEGYDVGTDAIGRPDGVEVPIDRKLPFRTIGRLIQEDVCLMQPSEDGHVLTGAVLCFPASWTLSEKIGRALPGIHKPIETYDASLGKRVQRMFSALRVDQPLWRANALLYEKSDLFAPRSESDDTPHTTAQGRYLRSERQVLLRLPETGAIVFSIHTYLIDRSNLTAEQLKEIAQVEARAGAD
ncbi:MAG: DUF3445 domain-containing protein [Boseongicola sp.]